MGPGKPPYLAGMVHPCLSTPFGVLFTLFCLTPLTGAWAQAPVITGITPQPGARSASVSTPLTATLSQPLTAASAPALQVYSAQRGGRRTLASPATVSGSALIFNPAPLPFLPGETVRYTLTRAAAGSGGSLARPWTGQFTTAVGGTGEGRFQVPAATPEVVVGSGPRGVALGDMDGDGDADLLSVSSGGVSLRFNDGTGSFAPRTPLSGDIAVGSGALSIALGDVDGDGDLDFVTGNYGSFSVSVRRNDGSGNFLAALSSEPATAGRGGGVALGDVDGDGDLDIVAANYGASSVSVLLNDGHGTFATPNTSYYPAVGLNPYGIALGDVDNDGDLDLLTTNAGMLINSTIGTTVSVRLNNGAGIFTAPATNADPTVGDTPYSISLGDIDGDGDLDFVTANLNSGNLSVRLNNGQGSFSPPAANANPLVGNPAYSATLDDVDGDGDLDLLAASNRTNRGYLNVLLNDGTGNFAAPSALPPVQVGQEPYSLAVGDVDGDGDLDAVLGNRGSFTANTNTVSVRLNQPRVLGTTAARLTAWELYPNPAHRRATLAGVAPHTAVQVLDALGRPVLRTQADAQGRAHLSWPASLPAGVYLVRCGALARRLAVE